MQLKTLFKTLLVMVALIGVSPSSAMAGANTYEHQRAVAQEQAYQACMWQHYECYFVPVNMTYQWYTTYPDPNGAAGSWVLRTDRFEFKYTTECGVEYYGVEVNSERHIEPFWPDEHHHHARELYDTHSEDTFGCYDHGGGSTTN